ncbi:aromatic ring-hydroxylating dioxygenase subunit alpha [Pendulispora rubella]|uniref:Aromatic ring-hydroxylating dioxygenase subunit alpha n=1 Tax=Pendulispora rubella TaxID=2741070 RepID=A0ABZ2KXH9_9BACT
MEPTLEQIIGDYDEGAPLAEASTIPGPWYTDPRVADLERRTVWSRTWQLAARVDQVALPGQYVTTTIAGEPIVVVRGDDGALRAFYNVCRHHAAAVMTLPEGRAPHLRCPYHGWTYTLDGALKGVTEFAGVCHFDRTKNGLVPVPHVAVWEKFVMVALDADTPPLGVWLASLRERVTPLHLGALHFAERRVFTLGCNWKVFIDNYLDGGYHVPHLHKGLSSILKHNDYTIENGERYCVQSSPVDASAGEEMTASVRQGQAHYFWLYPNLMLNWYEGYLDTNLVIPLGIDKTQVIFDFYFDDVRESSQERNRRSIDVSVRIQDEDHAICESVQRGLSSRAYHAGRLSVRREAGEHLFHRLLASDLRR